MTALKINAWLGYKNNRVAQIAGISVGSLWRDFPNKDALVTALIVAEHESLLAKLDAAAPQLEGCNAQTIGQAIVESETGNSKVDQLELEQRVYRALSGDLNFTATKSLRRLHSDLNFSLI